MSEAVNAPLDAFTVYHTMADSQSQIGTFGAGLLFGPTVRSLPRLTVRRRVSAEYTPGNGPTMLEMLMSVLLAVHLLSVNVAGVGPLMAIWLHRRCYRHGDAAAGEIGRRLAKASVTLLTLGMVLGSLLLGLMWHFESGSYFDALSQFPARKYWYGLAELVFYYACMWPYVALWKWGSAHRFWHGLLAVLAATNLLYHFPPLMSAIAVIATRPEWQGIVISPSTFRTLMLDNEVLARVAHVLLASLATSGVAVMIIALRAAQQEVESNAYARVASFGARIALVTTLAQLLVGVWLLVAVPARAQAALLGGDALATGWLVASVVAALALMHQLATVAMGEVDRKSIVRSAVLLAAVVVMMSGTLRRIQKDAAGQQRIPTNQQDARHIDRAPASPEFSPLT